MKEIIGNLWDFHDKGEIICITTNYTLNQRDELVMGGGCAREAVERYPHLPKTLGEIYLESHNVPVFLEKENIITFPTKKEVWKDSTLSLIEYSAKYLVNLVANIDKNIYIPRPGCGLGGLHWSVVKPCLEAILIEDKFIIISNVP